MKMYSHGLYVNLLFDTRKINGTRDYEINHIGKTVFLTREEAKAAEDGRLFLLPLEPGRSMLCQEYFERPWVMKNVTLCVQYQSSTGIIFYMGYDVFRDLVERGRITPLSPEGEKTLEGKANV